MAAALETASPSAVTPPRQRSTPPRNAAPHDDWTARVPGVFTGVLAVLAVMCAAAAISEAVFFRSQPLRELIDDVLVPAPANLGYAAFVGVLAASVARRKQIALAALFTYFGVQVVFDLGLLTFARADRPACSTGSAGRRGGSPARPALNLAISIGVADRAVAGARPSSTRRCSAPACGRR